MDDEAVWTQAVLSAWVDERLPVGTLMMLPDIYFTPNGGRGLALEVDYVGMVSQVGDAQYVFVSGWDVLARERDGQNVAREAFVRLDALHLPGVLTHPKFEPEP